MEVSVANSQISGLVGGGGGACLASATWLLIARGFAEGGGRKGGRLREPCRTCVEDLAWGSGSAVEHAVTFGKRLYFSGPHFPLP